MLDLNMLDLNMQVLSPLHLPLLLKELLLLKDPLLLKEQPWLLKLPQVVRMVERATGATVERAKEVKAVKAVKDEDMVAKGTVAVAKGGMVDMAVDKAKIQPLQLKAIKEKDTLVKM